MVAPIRDLRNIVFQTSALISSVQQIALGIDDCEMTDIQDIANVIFSGDDCNKVRG